MTTVHGHEIIEFLGTQSEGITAEDLATYVKTTYGSETSFFTCCAENLSLEELLQFLAERGKVAFKDARYFLGDTPPCDHDHGHHH